MTHGIWCEVSGGVTGTRAAWLKDGDGQRVEFADLGAAEQKAASLRDSVARSSSTVRFSYQAMELDNV